MLSLIITAVDIFNGGEFFNRVDGVGVVGGGDAASVVGGSVWLL